MTEKAEFDSWRGKELFSKTFRRSMGQIQPSVLWIPGVFSPRVQQQGLEADNSPPLVSRLSYVTTSTFPYVLLAWCLWSAPLRYNRMVTQYAHTVSVFLWKRRAGNKQVLRVQCFTDIINNDTRHKTFGSNAVLSWRYIPPPTLAVPSLSVRYSSIMCRLLQPCNTMSDRTKQYVCDRLIRLCIEWYFSR
jgi:hypothetical protein